MLFTESSSDIRCGNCTKDVSGIGGVKTAYVVFKKNKKLFAKVCRDMAFSENHIDSSRELLHLPKIFPTQNIAYKSAELNTNLAPEIAERKRN